MTGKPEIDLPLVTRNGTPAISKRDRIFAATVELLLEEGLVVVQTRAVTERAGVGTGLLNHYFRWPELRAAAWSVIFADIAEDMRRAKESPAQSLDRFFKESFSPEAQPIWRLWIEAESLGSQDEWLAKAVETARRRLRDGLTALLVEGLAQQGLSLASPRDAALRLEALRDGLIGLLLARDHEIDSAKAEAHLREALRRET